MNFPKPVTKRLTTPSGITVEYDLWGELEKERNLAFAWGRPDKALMESDC